MEIYMCDRCNRVYEKRKNCPVEDRQNHTYIGIGVVMKSSYEYEDDVVRAKDALDLCAACQAELFRWLNGESIEVKDDELRKGS